MVKKFVKNYYKYYSKNEIEIVSEWMKSICIDNFNIERANTGLHDVFVVHKEVSFLVEVKTDEPYWFSRTSNIGLDYYSSFTYLKDADRFGFWIQPNELTRFKNSIKIDKKGKLFTCDAPVQVFYVRDTLLLAYSNNSLQDPAFVDYLEKNYRLRVNDKKSYGIRDTWQSAAYFVNPLTDAKLKQCEIQNLNQLIKAVKDFNNNKR